MAGFSSFTTINNSRVNVLKNRVQVFEAFDPTVVPHPDGVEFDALWDTGATNTVISQRVVDALKLKPAGSARVFHAQGDETAEVYYVNVLLPNKVRFDILRVTKGKPQGTDLLIGMDIIGAGDFAVSSFGGQTKFTFRFPSMQSFDFVQASSPPQAKSNKVGRNDPCPCGSGKKYKRCCGRITRPATKPPF